MTLKNLLSELFLLFTPDVTLSMFSFLLYKGRGSGSCGNKKEVQSLLGEVKRCKKGEMTEVLDSTRDADRVTPERRLTNRYDDLLPHEQKGSFCFLCLGLRV